jgi:hypothetical protein
MHLAAWWLPVTTLAVLAAALVFIALNTSRTSAAKVGLDAILAAGVLMYAASGRLIASRRPDNAIGRVDRRFNRARYSAERLLAAFAARLTEELDADAVTEDLTRSVHTALEPAHVSIWLSER